MGIYLCGNLDGDGFFAAMEQRTQRRSRALKADLDNAPVHGNNFAAENGALSFHGSSDDDRLEIRSWFREPSLYHYGWVSSKKGFFEGQHSYSPEAKEE
jgi:hypothetical protein